VVKPGEKIGDYTIESISQEGTNNTVKLKSADKELDFPMGMQFRREDGGEWKMGVKPVEYVSTSGSYSSSGSSYSSGSSRTSSGGSGGSNSSSMSSGSSSNDSSGGGDSLLERLRKRREADGR
jgi:hypothetical protein